MRKEKRRGAKRIFFAIMILSLSIVIVLFPFLPTFNDNGGFGFLRSVVGETSKNRGEWHGMQDNA